MLNRRRPHAVAAAEDALIRCVRAKGSVARGALADELGLVPSTIGVYVERLVQQGFLLESLAPERGLGRPPVLLQLNPQRGRFIGVDFDGHELAGIAVDFSQTVLNEVCHALDAEATRETVLNALQQTIQQLIAQHPSDVLGIGVALPGDVDHEHGLVRCLAPRSSSHSNNPASSNLAEAAGSFIPVAQILTERIGIPVTIENNIRSMALAEYWFGQGKGMARLVCLGVRSGLGLGIVLDGRLYRGANNRAGELSSWLWPSFSSSSATFAPGSAELVQGVCHSLRPLDTVGSATAILKELRRRLAAGEPSLLSQQAGRIEMATFLDAVAQEDALAVEMIQTAAACHAEVSQTLASLLDPEQIIVAGPFIQSPVYLQALEKGCRTLGGDLLASRVVPSELGPFAGACGAAAIAVHHWTPRVTP